MSAFKPAITLMNRLSYPQKFLLISIVFSMPIALMMYLLITQIKDRIDFSKKEILGNAYLQPVSRVWEQTLRGKIASEVEDDNYSFKQLDEALEKLSNVEKKLGTDLRSSEQFAELNKYFQTLSRKNNNQNSFIYSQIVNATERLRLQVGDSSNLILDPSLDSYYMMDASLLKLPQMQRVLAEIKSLTLRINQSKQINSEQRRRLIELSAILEEQILLLVRNINVGINNNPLGNLKPQLSNRFKTFAKDIQLLTKEINRLERAERELIFPNPELVQKNLDSSFSLSDQIIEELDLILEYRIQHLEQRGQFIALFVAITLVIVIYLFIAFYLAVMQTVQNLALAAKRMTNGNSGVIEAITLENKDELGKVVESFNQIAVALVEAINASRQAEAKYRSIFENSIEGIFQTTPDGKYISANPALAKMYGYDSPQELIAAYTNIEQQLYVDPNRRLEFTAQMQQHGQLIGFESEVYRSDGATIWISENARSVFAATGELLYYEGSVQDISDRVLAEKSLLEANLEISLLNERLKAENMRMSSELLVSRHLQKMILPKDEELEEITSLDIAGYMEPATEVGGDYYDVLRKGEHIKIGIGDVTGHGLESSVLMLMVQTAVRTLLLNDERDPVKFLDTLNAVIYSNVQRMKSSKNLTLAIVDYHAGNICVSGQHEEMIIVRANGDIERIDTIDLGFPIGLELEIADFIAHRNIPLFAGDIVALYTDGITEAENLEREQYGLEKLFSVIQQNRHLSAQEIRQAVVNDLRSYIGKQKVYDDITLVVIKQK